ncbi:MAG: hypothetical protein LIV24_00220 [Eubacterium sp.]|nr:hypothetical protein [Eubacterium sp.]
MIRLKPMSIHQLKELIKGKKVICFGTGLQGQRVAMYFYIWGLEDNLIAYADNNRSKVGGSVSYQGKDIPIISAEDILNYDPDKIFILITSIYYEQIYEGLNNILSGVDIQVASLDETSDVELESSTYLAPSKENDNPIIPKIIHYAWFGGNKPESITRNIENWKKLCPDYEFIEWNESNYDIKKNKYMYQAYQKQIWGFVPDYLRLDVLYKYGGIYLDTDIELIKKPDQLLFQKCFGCIDGSLTMNLGSGFGSVPNMDIIRKLRDYYDDCKFVRQDGSVDKTSCGTHSLKVLIKYGIEINNKFQNVDGMNIYPMIFQGKNQHSGKVKVTDKTFWIHHGNMSWFK